MQRRFRISVILLTGLAISFGVFPFPRHMLVQLSAQDPASRDATAWDTRSMAIVLLGNYPEATDAPTRAALRDAVATYDRGWSNHCASL